MPFFAVYNKRNSLLEKEKDGTYRWKNQMRPIFQGEKKIDFCKGKTKGGKFFNGRKTTDASSGGIEAIPK